MQIALNKSKVIKSNANDSKTEITGSALESRIHE